jgi:hypothetical protein
MCIGKIKKYKENNKININVGHYEQHLQNGNSNTHSYLILLQRTESLITGQAIKVSGNPLDFSFLKL